MRLIQRGLFGTIVLVLALVAVMANGAEANPLALKCTSTGAFFPPVLNAPPTTADVMVAAGGKCSARLGTVTFAGVVTADTVPDGNGCISINSNGPSTAFNAKGDSFEYTITGTQCFKDANGNPPTTSGFCGAATDTFTSEIAGLFLVSDGTGHLAGASGSGTVTSAVNHCNPGFPFGNSFKSTFKGTIQQ
jgi:hypothetical protein